MISYYGYTISPNQLETDEGFLICRNVPIARIGDQEYLPSELGLQGGGLITVHRPEEEVFSAATIASFEGKPVTDDHPHTLIDADTAAIYSKGHAQNVRRGTGEWADYLLADLHIQDKDLIQKIKAGKREVSCGYLTEYEANGDGTYTQKNIRGNHIAVVTEGRAGHEAAIMDSNRISAQKPERKRNNMKTVLSKLFGIAAEGKTAEEIQALALDTAEALNVSDAAPEAEEPESKEEEPEATADEQPASTEDEAPEPDESAEDAAPEAAADEAPKAEDCMDAGFIAKLDSVLDMVGRLCDALIPKAPEPTADPIEAAIEAISEISDCADESPEAQAEAKVVPAESMDCGGAMDAAARRDILTAMRPVVAAISDEAQRKAVSEALVSALGSKKNDIAAVADALDLKAAEAKKNNRMNADDLQKLYDSMNPHKKG